MRRAHDWTRDAEFVPIRVQRNLCFPQETLLVTKEGNMVRTRWATLTLAGTLLLTASGCCGGLLDRFQSWRHPGGADCTCMESGVHGGVPAGVEMPVSGPPLLAPDPTFTGPVPATIPTGPPPRIVPTPIPSATPMPWTGQH
jgi:hypothetical protein